MTQEFESGATRRVGGAAGGIASKFTPATNGQQLSVNALWFLDDSVSTITFPDIASTEAGDFLAIMTASEIASPYSNFSGNVTVVNNAPIQVGSTLFSSGEYSLGGFTVFYSNGDYWQTNQYIPNEYKNSAVISTTVNSLTPAAIGWDGNGSIKMRITMDGAGGGGAVRNASTSTYATGGGSGARVIFETIPLNSTELANVAIVIGTGGMLAAALSTNGSAGGNTLFRYNSVNIIQVAGGAGGIQGSGLNPIFPAAATPTIASSPVVERIIESHNGNSSEPVNGTDKSYFGHSTSDITNVYFPFGGAPSFLSDGGKPAYITRDCQSTELHAGFGAGYGGSTVPRDATFQSGGSARALIEWVEVSS